MQVIGEATVEVCYNQQKESLPLIVVAGGGPALLGIGTGSVVFVLIGRQ